MPASKNEATVRERLLAAANALFYDEGVHTVGIDRIIERAGVAKASLYSTFGSKEELVRAYLAGRHELRKQRILERLAKHRVPRDRILGIFDQLGETIMSPAYRGCAFINASAEGPPTDKTRSVCDESRAWLRTLFRQLTREFGAVSPDELSDQLMLLYDGAIITASMDLDPSSAAKARGMAAALLDAHAARPQAIRKKTRARPVKRGGLRL